MTDNKLPAFRFAISQIEFPFFYKGDTNSLSGAEPGRPRYGLSFPVEEFPQKILLAIEGAAEALQTVRNLSRENFGCHSFYPPIMTEANGRYEDLLKIFTVADIRNVGRDRLFRGIPAEIIVRPFWFSSRNKPAGYFGLSPEEVIFDIAHVIDPSDVGRWDKGPVL